MRFLVLFLTIFLCAIQPSGAQESRVALVKVLEGSAFTIQHGKRQELRVGQQIYRRDVGGNGERHRRTDVQGWVAYFGWTKFSHCFQRIPVLAE